MVCFGLHKGVVYKGTQKATGRKVAMKKIRLETEEEGKLISNIKEFHLLRLEKYRY
jgi:hypothetical protein